MLTSTYVEDMTSNELQSTSQSIAEQVIADGFHAHRQAVAVLVAEAERRGVDAVLTGVLADTAAPSVVRERALGMVLSSLAQLAELPVRNDRAGGSPVSSPGSLVEVTDLPYRASAPVDRQRDLPARQCA